MEVTVSCAAGIKRRRPSCGVNRQIQLPSFFRNALQRWGLKSLVKAPSLLFGLGLVVFGAVYILGRDYLMEIVGVSIMWIVILSVLFLRKRWSSVLRAFTKKTSGFFTTSSKGTLPDHFRPGVLDLFSDRW